MKNKLAFGLIIFFTINFSVSAQKNKIRFRSINTFGLVGGESKASIAFQSVNGIQFSSWFSGIGVGVDDYRYKTLPLFIDGRWFFGDNKNEFIYGNVGYNFPMKNKPGKEIWYYDTYHFTGGIYTDIGIGYQVPLYKKSSVLFSLGYSYKQVQTEYGITPLCTGCQPSWYNYKLGLGRIALRTGVEF
jgi:hypothetical protein